MKKKVVVFSQLDQDIHKRLEQQYRVVQIQPKLGDVNEQILAETADADGMIGSGRLLNESNLQYAQQLKIISSVSVGYDNYDLQFLNQKKVWLANTPHVLTETTADLAFTLLLSAAKKSPFFRCLDQTGQLETYSRIRPIWLRCLWKNLGYYWVRAYWRSCRAARILRFQYECAVP